MAETAVFGGHSHNAVRRQPRTVVLQEDAVEKLVVRAASI
jgi:hypothetical protein